MDLWGRVFVYCQLMKQQSILTLHEQLVEFQQCRWSDNHGSPSEVAWVEKQRPETKQKSMTVSGMSTSACLNLDDCTNDICVSKTSMED
jgi:hypothetical protein